MKVENGILFLSEPICDPELLYSCTEVDKTLVLTPSDIGQPIKNGTLWVGVGQGEYNFKIDSQSGVITLTPRGIVPEIVKQAQKIMGTDKQISDITKDDILDKIFTLAHEVENTDFRQVSNFKVAIDTFQWLYEQVRKQPPKKISHDIDTSDEFLEKWGIKNEKTV